MQAKASAKVAAMKARLKALSQTVADAAESRLCQEKQLTQLQTELQVLRL